MDPISLVVGAGLLGAGWIMGRFGHRAARKPASHAPAERAVCGCGHDLALHDREAGQCHAEYMRKVGYGGGMREWARCACRRYTGPTPLEELFSPPMLPPTAEQQ
ncbi:hypothetical protein IU501_23360 [Nocardia otitidiscaviarum]|uniref:hypothetical protein n=1 Tax=Nocardia otitidiscaviarum TaxID=1823 RepID=UPI0004A73446|nr:hypothetical protein [Nocardia otitidiscaviarum]MBF6135934.1 hypothetical protein [Nocardia otitidiscaviarum]MBF6237978.1 hypothetical protein [Nocardia otitidiscaviarum]MBF6483689.1 hypothetical protein [Nocardia otitidiscaviarum]